MSIVSKKGNMLSDNSLGLILGAAVVFLLFYLIAMIWFFSPSFDKGEEVAESYFKSLKKSVSEVDDMGKSSFFMLDTSDKELMFYLVNFGEALNFVRDDKEFIRSARGGSLCVCYLQLERVLCRYCMDLDPPVSCCGDLPYEDVPWIIKEGEVLDLEKKEEGNYVFTRK